MNTASIIVLAVVIALCGLALWRVRKKGAPCECGGNRTCARGSGGCCCGGGKKA